MSVYLEILSTLLSIGKDENRVSGKMRCHWLHIPAADVACNVHVSKALDLVPEYVLVCGLIKYKEKSG